MSLQCHKHGKERWIWNNKMITGTGKCCYYSLAIDEKENDFRKLESPGWKVICNSKLQHYTNLLYRTLEWDIHELDCLNRGYPETTWGRGGQRIRGKSILRCKCITIADSWREHLTRNKTQGMNNKKMKDFLSLYLKTPK